MKNLSKTVKKSILFICDDNSVCSQMAEALLRAKASDIFDVYSAGVQSEPIDARTLNVLSDFSLPTEHLMSKSTEEFIGKTFDYVIMLCHLASQKTLSSPQSYPQALKQLSWHFTDPKLNDSPYSFVTVLTQLSSRIAMFIEIEKEALHNFQHKFQQESQHKPQPSSQYNSQQYNSQQSSISNRPNKKAEQLDPIVFYKCLTDDIRLKCLMLLQYHGELCVCELMTALKEESQPKVSRNLALLKKASLLTTRKHGQWVFYQIDIHLPQWAAVVLAQTTENNLAFIQCNIQLLDQMGNRPDKTNFCGYT